MPDSSKKIDQKKFMWDGTVYESEKEAQDMKQKYETDNFEVEMLAEENKYLLYTRRVVTEIVLDGDPGA